MGCEGLEYTFEAILSEANVDKVVDFYSWENEDLFADQNEALEFCKIQAIEYQIQKEICCLSEYTYIGGDEFYSAQLVKTNNLINVDPINDEESGA